MSRAPCNDARRIDVRRIIPKGRHALTPAQYRRSLLRLPYPKIEKFVILFTHSAPHHHMTKGQPRMNSIISSLISFLLSIVQFIIMILISYVLEGLLFLFGGFGQAIRNFATNWTFAVLNVIGLTAILAGVYYFLAAPLPTIFIITLMITNILSILGIRGNTVNDDGSIEFANTGPNVATAYTIGRWVLAVICVATLGYKLYDPLAWVFAR